MAIDIEDLTNQIATLTRPGNVQLQSKGKPCGTLHCDQNRHLTIHLDQDVPLTIDDHWEAVCLDIFSSGEVIISGTRQYDSITVQAKKVQLSGELTIKKNLQLNCDRIIQRGGLYCNTGNVTVTANVLSVYGEVGLAGNLNIHLANFNVKPNAVMCLKNDTTTQPAVKISKGCVVGNNAALSVDDCWVDVNEFRVNGYVECHGTVLNAARMSIRSKNKKHTASFHADSSILNVTQSSTVDPNFVTTTLDGEVSLVSSKLKSNYILVNGHTTLTKSTVEQCQRMAVSTSGTVTIHDSSSVTARKVVNEGHVELQNSSKLCCDEIATLNTIEANASAVSIKKKLQMLNRNTRLIMNNGSVLQVHEGLMDGHVVLDHSSMIGGNIESFANVSMQMAQVGLQKLCNQLEADMTICKSQVNCGKWDANAMIKQSTLTADTIEVSMGEFRADDSEVSATTVTENSALYLNKSHLKAEELSVHGQFQASESKVSASNIITHEHSDTQVVDGLVSSDQAIFAGHGVMKSTCITSTSAFVNAQLELQQNSGFEAENAVFGKNSIVHSDESSIVVDEQLVNRGILVVERADAPRTIADSTKQKQSVAKKSQGSEEQKEFGIRAGDFVSGGVTVLQGSTLKTEHGITLNPTSKTIVNQSKIQAGNNLFLQGESQFVGSEVTAKDSMCVSECAQVQVKATKFNAENEIRVHESAEICGTDLYVKCSGFRNLGLLEMTKQFQAEVDTFINKGCLEGGNLVSIKADLFFINMLGKLSGNYLNVKSAIASANVLADMHGRDMLSSTGLINANLFGRQCSWRQINNGIINFNMGLSGAFSSPSNWDMVWQLSNLVPLSRAILCGVYPNATATINAIYNMAIYGDRCVTAVQDIYEDFSSSDLSLGDYIQDRMSQKSTWEDSIAKLIYTANMSVSAVNLYDARYKEGAIEGPSVVPDEHSFDQANFSLCSASSTVASVGLSVAGASSTSNGVFNNNSGVQLAGTVSQNAYYDSNSGVSVALQHHTTAARHQRNSGYAGSMVGAINKAGVTMENEGIIDGCHRGNLDFSDIQLKDSSHLRGDHMRVHSNTATLKGSTNLSSANIDINHFDGAGDLVSKTGDYANYAVRDNLSIKTQQHVEVDKQVQRNCGLSVTAPSIGITVDYVTKNDVILTTTQGDLDLAGDIKAKNVIGKSAANTHTSGNITADQDDVFQSRGNHHNVGGHLKGRTTVVCASEVLNEKREGAEHGTTGIIEGETVFVDAREGDLINRAGTIRSTKQTVTHSKGDTINECVETNNAGQLDGMKDYDQGVIQGGSGEDHDGKGYIGVAEGEFINDASSIISEGDNIILAKKGFHANARAHSYVSDFSESRSGSIFGEKTTRVRRDAQIAGNKISSGKGHNTIIAEEGGINATATAFISATGTDLEARDDIVLTSMRAETSITNKSSALGGFVSSESTTKETVSQASVIDDDGISCIHSKQGAIRTKGTNMVGKGKLDVHAKDDIVMASEVLQIDTRSKSSSIEIDPGVTTGINYSQTRSCTHNERVGEGCLHRSEVNLESDEGNVTLRGLPVHANKSRVRAIKFNQEAIALHNTRKCETTSIGVSGSVANTNSVKVSVSQTSQKSTNTDHANQSMVLDELDVQAKEWNITGATTHVGKLRGHADKVTATSLQDTTHSKTTSIGANSTGAVSFSQVSDDAVVTSERAGLHISGGKLEPEGEGFTTDETVLTGADIITQADGQYHTHHLTNHDLVDRVQSSSIGVSIQLDASSGQVHVHADQLHTEDKIVRHSVFTGEAEQISGHYVSDLGQASGEIQHRSTPSFLQSIDITLQIPKYQTESTANNTPPVAGQLYEEVASVDESHDTSESLPDVAMDEMAEDPLVDDIFEPGFVPDEFDSQNNTEKTFSEVIGEHFQDQQSGPHLSSAHVHKVDDDHDANCGVEEKYKYQALKKIADGHQLASSVIAQATDCPALGKHLGRAGTLLNFAGNYQHARAEGSEAPLADAVKSTVADAAVAEGVVMAVGAGVAAGIEGLAIVGNYQREYSLYSARPNDLGREVVQMQSVLTDPNASEMERMMARRRFDRMQKQYADERIPTNTSVVLEEAGNVTKSFIDAALHPKSTTASAASKFGHFATKRTDSGTGAGSSLTSTCKQ